MTLKIGDKVAIINYYTVVENRMAVKKEKILPGEIEAVRTGGNTFLVKFSLPKDKYTRGYFTKEQLTKLEAAKVEDK